MTPANFRDETIDSVPTGDQRPLHRVFGSHFGTLEQ